MSRGSGRVNTHYSEEEGSEPLKPALQLLLFQNLTDQQRPCGAKLSLPERVLIFSVVGPA
jgi:hypothetical protein